MTTILKALQELEGRTGDPAAVAPPNPRPPSVQPPSPTLGLRAQRRIATAGVLVGLALAVAAAVEVGRWSNAPADGAARRSFAARSAENAPAAAPRHDPFVASQPPAAAARDVGTANANQPRTDEPNLKSGASIARAETADAPRATLLPRGDDRNVDVPARSPVSARPRDTDVNQRRAAVAPPASARGRRASPDSPIAVIAITYSADASERTAALRVDGETRRVRQGDSVRGVDVQLITPDSVYLRRGKEIFAVDPER